MQLTADIDPDRQVDASSLDTQQEKAVNQVALALDRTNDPNVTTATLLAEILRTFLGTHYSIRLLLSERAKRPQSGTDAVSLVREQIEKVFLVSLLQADWRTYVPVYFQEDWCRSYRHFLVQKQELQGLERWAGFWSDVGHYHERRRKECSVSEAVRDLVEFRALNPSAERPSALRGVKVPQFPTPGEVLKLARDSERPALARWYEEYKAVCGYTHIGAEKLLMTTATGGKVDFSTEQIQMFFTKELASKAWLSYVACAYTATELLGRTGGAFEPQEEVMKLWNLLLECGLVVRVFWDLRSKTLLSLPNWAPSYSAP